MCLPACQSGLIDRAHQPLYMDVLLQKINEQLLFGTLFRFPFSISVAKPMQALL